jgi:hypothetical protein
MCLTEFSIYVFNYIFNARKTNVLFIDIFIVVDHTFCKVVGVFLVYWVVIVEHYKKIHGFYFKVDEFEKKTARIAYFFFMLLR